MGTGIKQVFLFAAAVACAAGASAAEDPAALLSLEPIVVSRSSLSLVPSYSLEADYLDRASFGSALEALERLPVDLQGRTGHAGIQADFSLRGSSSQGVQILLDGRRINDPQTGHYNCDIPLTQASLERVDLFPGAGSALLGTDAVGGAVNFVTKRPVAKQRTMELSYGDFRSASQRFSISEKNERSGVRFSLENESSDGYSYDTDYRKFTTDLVSTVELPAGDYGLTLGFQEKEYGAFDFYSPFKGYPSKEWTKTILVNNEFDLELAGMQVKPACVFRRHYDTFILDKTSRRSSYINHHRTDLLSPSVYFQKEAGALGMVGLGTEYGMETIRSSNLGDHDRRHRSLFCDESKELTDRLSGVVAYRYDDYDGFLPTHAGSLSLRYRLDGHSRLHCGFSRSIRAPSFTELYYRDPVTVGDQGLCAEKSNSIETGYAFQDDQLSLSATAFARQERDSIDWVKQDAVDGLWQVRNITSADVVGFETVARVALGKDRALSSFYTYIDKRIDDQGLQYKYGPNYARHHASAELSWDLPFGRQTLGCQYKKRPARRGWLLIDGRISWRLRGLPAFGLREGVVSEVYVRATNIGNTSYADIEGIPGPGRWVETGVRLEW